MRTPEGRTVMPVRAPRSLSRSTVVATEIRALEHLRICAAGLRDRVVYRRVPADVATPHLLRLAARWRAQETRLAQQVTARLSSADQEAAELHTRRLQLEAELAASASGAGVPTSPAQLSERPRRRSADHAVTGMEPLEGRERHVWALERREELARRCQDDAAWSTLAAEARAVGEREEVARCELAVIQGRLREVEVQRAAAAAQLTDLHAQCRHAVDARTARYLRARSGLLGLPASDLTPPPFASTTSPALQGATR